MMMMRGRRKSIGTGLEVKKGEETEEDGERCGGKERRGKRGRGRTATMKRMKIKKI